MRFRFTQAATFLLLLLASAIESRPSFTPPSRIPRNLRSNLNRPTKTSIQPGLVAITSPFSTLEENLVLAFKLADFDHELPDLNIEPELTSEQSSPSPQAIVQYVFETASLSNQAAATIKADGKTITCSLSELKSTLSSFITSSSSSSVITVNINTPPASTPSPTLIVYDVPPSLQNHPSVKLLLSSKDTILLSLSPQSPSPSPSTLSTSDKDSTRTITTPSSTFLTTSPQSSRALSKIKNDITTRIKTNRINQATTLLPHLTNTITTLTRELSQSQTSRKTITSETLRDSLNSLRGSYCRGVHEVLLGSVKAPPGLFGQTLEEERDGFRRFMIDCDSDSVGDGRRSSNGNDNVITVIDKKVEEEVIGNVKQKLYGGAQYHRALREMSLIVSQTPTQTITDEEITLASGGVGKTHDGSDFLRAASVLAMTKAYVGFEDVVLTFARRCGFIMKRNFEAVEYIVDKEIKREEEERAKGTKTFPIVGTFDSDSQAPFRKIVRRIYYDFVDKRTLAVVEHCRADLEALTKYITWDLAERGVSALPAALGVEGRGEKGEVKVFTQAVDNALSSGGKQKEVDRSPIVVVAAAAAVMRSPTNWLRKRRKKKDVGDDIMSQYNAARSLDFKGDAEGLVDFAFSASVMMPLNDEDEGDREEDSTTVASTPKLNTLPKSAADQALMLALQQVASRTDTDKTSAVINTLVTHLSVKWRENFAKQVATKFNGFFLMSFLEEFQEVLREEIGEVYDHEGDSSSQYQVDDDDDYDEEEEDGEHRNRSKGGILDVKEMKSKLQTVEDEISSELSELLKLRSKLEGIFRGEE